MNGNTGFTVAETLVALVFTLVISVGLMGIFASYTARGAVTALDMKSGMLVLKTDRLIREKAAEVNIPYWESGSDQDAVLHDTFMNLKGLETGTIIETAVNLTDKEGRIRGILVTWQLGGRTYTTEALYASVPVLKGRPGI
jgi:hypothetical protein